jgi:uncharacterized phiE125 gp8 family phage protein
MTLVRFAAPVEPPVSLNEVITHLNLGGTAYDVVQLNGYLQAAVGQFDGDAGLSGRALCSQTWDYKLDEFPDGEIEIPLPPLQSITSVIYVDGSTGTPQTLAAIKYRVLGVGGWDPGRITPAFGETWPGTRMQAEAVTIRFVAGYGAATSVPEVIRHDILDLVAWMFEHRGDEAGLDMPPVPKSLGLYRVWNL